MIMYKIKTSITIEVSLIECMSCRMTCIVTFVGYSEINVQEGKLCDCEAIQKDVTCNFLGLIINRF